MKSITNGVFVGRYVWHTVCPRFRFGTIWMLFHLLTRSRELLTQKPTRWCWHDIELRLNLNLDINILNSFCVRLYISNRLFPTIDIRKIPIIFERQWCLLSLSWKTIWHMCTKRLMIFKFYLSIGINNIFEYSSLFFCEIIMRI